MAKEIEENEEIIENGEPDADVIFMTPNMLNTHVMDDAPKQYYDYAIKMANVQNSGKMDEYIFAALVYPHVFSSSKYSIGSPDVPPVFLFLYLYSDILSGTISS